MTAQLAPNNSLQKKWDEATPDANGGDLQSKWDEAAPAEPLQAKWDEATPDPAPTYYQNPLDQAIAEIPGVRQVYRGLTNTMQDAKALGYRAKALFHSATDSPAYAEEANAAADAIQAEQARSEAEFNKTSGLGGNTVAGITRSLGQALATRGMGGGAPSMIAGASAIQGNQALYEGQKAGLTGTDLAAHVVSQAGIEAIPATMSQVAGLGGLEKRIASMGEPVMRGVKAALERFGRTSLEELPEELVTTLGQQVEDSVSGVNPANTADLVNGAFQTTLQTLGSAGLVEVPSAIGRSAPQAGPGATQPPAPTQTAPAPQNVPQQTVEEEYAGLFDEEPAAPSPPAAPSVSAQIMARQQQAYPNPATVQPPTPATPQEAEVAPEQPQPQPETRNEEKGQEAEVLTPKAGVEHTPAPAPASLKEAWDYYNDSTNQVPVDLVNTVEALIAEGKAPKKLQRHIDKYRSAITEDMKVYGGRSGLGNEAEDAFMSAVEAMAEKGNKQSKIPTAPKRKVDPVDLSAIQNASSEADINKAFGSIMMRTMEGLSFPTPEQQASMREAAAKRSAELAASSPQPTEPTNATPAHNLTATPAAQQPEAAVAQQAAPEVPLTAPIRFKRTGKGDAAVHEATVEGRPVSISKGKDGWEVRLDGKVADIHPTLKEAREYAGGELRQDLRDQANAREAEQESQNDTAQGEVFYHATDAKDNLFEFNRFTHFGTADAANERLPAKRRYTADSSGERLIPVRLDIKNPLRIEDSGGHHSIDDLAYAAYDAGLMSYEEYKNRPDWHTKGSVEDWLAGKLKESGYDGLVYANSVEGGGGDSYVNISKDQVKHALATIPKSADTGIFRDLTAAAREGKRFVEDLHARIAPHLARIYQAAKSPVEFVRAAVAKIGEHIRPYAKRFMAEVKHGLRDETGAALNPFKKGALTKEAKGAGLLKAPAGEQTRQSGVAQGQREGINKNQADTRAMFDLAKQVLPAKEWKAIAKTARAIVSITRTTEAGKRRALDRLLQRQLGKIEHARALRDATDAIKKVKKLYNRLRPEVQAEVKKYTRAKGLSKMDAAALDAITDEVERQLELNESLNAGITAERARQTALNNDTAPAEVKKRAPIALANRAIENRLMRGVSTGILNLSNIVRGIVGKDTHVYKTLVSDLVEADTRTLMYLKKHTDMVIQRLAQAGLTPKKLGEMSRVLNDKAGEVEVAGVKMTKGERIEILLHLADPNTRASLTNPKSKGFLFSRAEEGRNRTLKITEEIAREIEQSATPEERAVARTFWDWANGELRDDVNAWSVENLGYKIFRSNEHWNRRRSITDQEPAVGLLAKDAASAQAEAGAYLKERTGGTQYIVVDDAFQHFASHVNATAALMGKFSASVNARRLLDTEAFQQAVKENRRTGGQVMAALNKRVEDWGKISGTKGDLLLPAVRAIGRRYAASKLAANLPVIISQPFSILSAQKVIPFKYLISSLRGKEEVWDSNARAEIDATPSAADLHYIIHGGGQHVITPGSMAGATAGEIFGTAKKPITERAMAGIQLGNDTAVFHIWRAAKEWGREQGLTGDALMEFTAKTARDAWLQTQPSNSSVYHPGIKLAARESSLAYALTMFQGQTSIQFQDAVDSLRDYQELPKEKQTSEAKALVLAKMARPIVLQAILFYGLKYGAEYGWEKIFGKDEQKAKRDKKFDPLADKSIEVLKSPLTSIPGAGPILDGFMDFAKRNATGEPVFGAPFDNPVTDAVSAVGEFPVRTAQALAAVSQGKQPSLTVVKRLAAGLDAITGFPFSSARGWFDAIMRKAGS